jgi:hypothetical protein
VGTLAFEHLVLCRYLKYQIFINLLSCKLWKPQVWLPKLSILIEFDLRFLYLLRISWNGDIRSSIELIWSIEHVEHKLQTVCYRVRV